MTFASQNHWNNELIYYLMEELWKRAATEFIGYFLKDDQFLSFCGATEYIGIVLRMHHL